MTLYFEVNDHGIEIFNSMLIEFKVQNQSICLHHVLCLVSHDIHVTVSAVKFWWFYVWFKAVLDLTSQD